MGALIFTLNLCHAGKRSHVKAYSSWLGFDYWWLSLYFHYYYFYYKCPGRAFISTMPSRGGDKVRRREVWRWAQEEAEKAAQNGSQSGDKSKLPFENWQ